MCRMRAEPPSLFPHGPLGRASTSGFSLIEALTVMAITTTLKMNSMIMI